MPIQAPSWTDFLSCPVCCNEFAVSQRIPITLGCGHTICRLCLATIQNRQCPIDQSVIITDIDSLPANHALLQLVNHSTVSTTGSNGTGDPVGSGDAIVTEGGPPYTTETSDKNGASVGQLPLSVQKLNSDDLKLYKTAKKHIEVMALHLRSSMGNGSVGTLLSRPMQRKLVALISCQLMEEEGRVRVLRAARSLGERTVTELILQHQNPQQLSSNLWAAVRSRGCQFLGPAMQEEVLKLVLLALEKGSALSRKVLVMFVVQRLETHYPQASKTSIGHVVQLLYRASCFKVSKRESDSSLMQLKEEFRTYDALRREHDAQIVQIATEGGLRIAPDQWSSLLYGDTLHKSHMQSIIDKLQTPSSFSQSVEELIIALQRTGDPANLSNLRPHLKFLAAIDANSEILQPPWGDISTALESARIVVNGLVDFLQHHGNRKLQDASLSQNISNVKYKISLCRDLTARRICPRGNMCTFAHSEEELERYRKNRKNSKLIGIGVSPLANAISPTSVKKEYQQAHNNHNKSFLNPREGGKLSPISATTSPMRFTAINHGKIKRNTFDMKSPLMPQGQSLPNMGHRGSASSAYHNSMLSKNGNLASVLPPTPSINLSPTGGHSYDMHPMGTMNYVKPDMRLSNLGVKPSQLTIRSSNNQQLPPRNMQMLSSTLIANNTNPPNLQGNASSINNPMNSNHYGSYNTRAAEYTSVNPLGVGSISPSALPGNKYFNGIKMRQHSNTLWEQQDPLHQQQQQHLQQMAMSNFDLIGPINQNPYYSSESASYFMRNSNKLGLNKSLNGLSDTQTAFAFPNNFSHNCNSTNFLSNNGTIDKDIISNTATGSAQISQSSYWNAPRTDPGAAASVCDIMKKCDGNAFTADFCNRESFVRSDSILDDDTSFDVPLSNVTMGSKFGPICPIYKGQSSSLVSTIPTMTTTTAVPSEDHPNVDSWLVTMTPNRSPINNELNLLNSSDSSRKIHYPELFLSNNDGTNVGLVFKSSQLQLQSQQQQKPSITDLDLVIEVGNVDTFKDSHSFQWNNTLPSLKSSTVNMWKDATSLATESDTIVAGAVDITNEKYDRGLDIEKELAEIVKDSTYTDDSGIKLE